MPTTVNGIGTHYYGRKNRQARSGVCRACGASGSLESYDTRLWFVIVYIPVIPLGRKRIIDQCPVCQRHWAADQDKWEMSKQLNVSGAMERYRAEPSPEAALDVHGQLLVFHLNEEADRFREGVLEQYADNAVLHAGVGMQMSEMGRFSEAVPLFEKALQLRPDLPEARVGAARDRMAHGKLDEARELLSFLEEPGAGQLHDLGPLEQLAGAYQQAGLHTQTLEICEHLLTEFPAAGEVHAFRRFVAVSEKALGRRESMLPKRSFSIRGLFDARSGRYAGWQRWAAVGTIVAVMVLMGLAITNEYRRRHRTVHVLNESGQTVQVTIDDQAPVQVARTTKLNLREGPHHVTVSGPITDELDIEVRTGYFDRWTEDPVWVINVGGGAALVHHTLYYARNPRPTDSRYLIGEPFVYFPHVDYVFEAPPQSMQVQSSTKEVIKTHLAHAGEPAYQLFQYAAATSDPELALRFAETRLLADPQDGPLLYSYTQAAESAGRDERAARFLKNGLWRRPISVPWHRAYQNLIDEVERETSLTTDYDVQLKQDPKNARLLYLRGRASAEHAESVEYFQRSRDADPALPWPWFALAYSAASRGDWQESQSLVDKSFELGLEDSTVVPFRHLVRLGAGEAAAMEAEYRRQFATQAAGGDVRGLLALCEVLAVQGKAEEARGILAEWEARLPAAARSGEAVQTCRQAVSYMLGDFEALAALSSAGQLPPELRLHVLTATGQPAVAAQDAALAESLKDPFNALAMCLAFGVSGNQAESQVWNDRACAELDQRDGDCRRVAAILRDSRSPSPRQLDEIVLSPPQKALVLAAAAFRFPAQKAEFAALARRLNVSRMPPYHLVHQATQMDERTP
jgi:tetratricopeptide (TPR) repeat protein